MDVMEELSATQETIDVASGLGEGELASIMGMKR